MYEHGDVLCDAEDDIVNQRHKSLCWNDSDETANPGVLERMSAAFETILGSPCEYEGLPQGRVECAQGSHGNIK